MTNSKIAQNSIRTLSAALLAYATLMPSALAEEIAVPANTQLYVVTDQFVSGKKKHTQLGQVVRASVWRDVVVDGQVVINSGAPVLVRVDRLKGSGMAGTRGKISLGAYDTVLVDGTSIELSGGYYKEGKGKIVLAATLAAVVFLPLIFLQGKSAHLPRGTVFDAYTKRRTNVSVEALRPAQKVNLSGVTVDRLNAEILYEELEGVEKPEFFTFSITVPAGSAGDFVIDQVNEKRLKDEITIDAEKIDESDMQSNWRGTVRIKALAKELRKGINTFEISTRHEGERLSQELILDIQL